MLFEINPSLLTTLTILREHAQSVLSINLLAPAQVVPFQNYYLKWIFHDAYLYMYTYYETSKKNHLKIVEDLTGNRLTFGRLITQCNQWETQWFNQMLTNFVNSSPTGQNISHFTDDIFRSIFVNEKFLVWLKFNWSLFLRVKLTIIQHWFR